METSIESWDGLLANPFLKAENIEGNTGDIVVLDVGIVSRDEESKPQASLTVEYKETRYRFDLNVTNTKFLRENGIETPKEMIGKIITLNKVKVNNPTTGKEVDGLRICEVKETKAKK